MFVAINNVWTPYTVSGLGTVTVDWARDYVSGAAPNMPDGSPSYTVDPYGQPGFVNGIYPAGTTLANLVGSAWGVSATKPDWGFPYQDNKVVIYGASIQGQLTVPPPTLKLFLDVNGFNPADPVNTNDHSWYVPCSLAGGASVSPTSLPQVIKVVAAYVNSSGAIVAPPNTTTAAITLSNVSRWNGIAMNASHATRLDDAADFEVVASNVSFAADNTARFQVRCWDYGALATATVTHSGQTSQPLSLPLDVHSNYIADGGWLAGTITVPDPGLGPGVDEEPDTDPDVSGPPIGIGIYGDGFVNFEEYRGFVVSGQHRRTNPFKKDLFVSSNLTTGIAFAYPNLPIATHRINGEDEPGVDEYQTADRVMNFKWQNNGYPGPVPGRDANNGQKALRVISVTSSQAWYGQTLPINVFNKTPNETDRIEINLTKHNALKKDAGFNNTQITNEIKRTTGHEIGHGINICDRGPLNTCNDGADVGTADSIMSDAFFGTGETDFRSKYNLLDARQIRLHIRW